MAAYYNEFDPFAAAWLKELIKDGLIADGIVDERSIADVQPEDLRGFTQCHFFAGIGGWSAAARLAGWDDDRPMWTGSPPCQPFSTAGNRKGKDDLLRHLWPVFFNLIRECRPPVVFGEQVASAIRMGWFDDLQKDLEAEGYASAMVVLPACSVGAPHKRDRLFYVAEGVGNAEHNGSYGSEVGRGFASARNDDQERPNVSKQFEGASRPKITGNIRNGEDTSGMADAQCDLSRDIARDNEEAQRIQEAQCQSEHGSDVPARCGPGDAQQGICGSDGLQGRRKSSMADTNNKGLQGYGRSEQVDDPQRRKESVRFSAESSKHYRCGSDDNFWAGSEHIYCRDGKERQIPVEPALFPLAHGIPNRVGTLRGAGNAIVPQVSAEVIGAYMSVEQCNDN